ncbi:Quinone oxidoreductase [Caballeronia glathei]|jgi:NADPH2:quinone reductase|uniref:NADPH:quinone oxidoreductase n=1 Tax=Caballeronia glathei TaxID=60547 RepID=A0A069PSR5_9BURK|nr:MULTISPECIES: NADPH:quinone oxidoreductase family protein [Burkholderiaceae]KDR43788.1 NADPH:quinone oxidoreductase [Caballeronia glathei]TCK43855.1 NADPH2:quinone reductase [Paraburkholderia sp. BL8N3]CDY75585.1 Quinone oxidoreductase [Caballeronia glathei]
MRAIRCNRYGPPETLTVENLPDLHPEAGEVVIDVKAASVNFPDVLIIQNKYQFKPPLPFTPGAELAGIVREVGAGVTRLRPGMRVAAYTAQGAFAEQARASEASCVALPDDVDLASAAAFTLAYGTSHHAVTDRGALKAGETMLVLGAAGGVGLAAVQIGKALGARVIAAASSAEKLALTVEHGADATIDYSREDLRERIRALTDGHGPDVIFDPVGGEYAEPAFRSIGWRGRYLVVGFANGEIPKLPFNLALLKGASIVGVFWGGHMQREADLAAAGFEQMIGWIREGRMRLHVSKRYTLDEVPQALDDMAHRRVTGKVVIEP